MARYDVDAGGTTHHPSEIRWEQPERTVRHDGSSTRSIYWSVLLVFSSSNNNQLVAAFEEWEAFHDGAQHTIILPPPNDVLGSDDTFTSVYIEIEDWPAFVSVNVSDFSVIVRPVEFS